MDTLPLTSSGRPTRQQMPRTPVPAGMRSEIAGLMSAMLQLVDRRSAAMVYLTATTHGEGTSTIARQVAADAARLDWCQTALVHANFDHPIPGWEDPPVGLLESVLSERDLPLRRTRVEGIEFAEGVMTNAPATIPKVDSVRALFAHLRKRFTLTIIDAPPVSSSRQAAAFSALADCVVLVVEAERTRASELERSLATLEQVGASVLGVVMNKRRRWIPRGLTQLA